MIDLTVLGTGSDICSAPKYPSQFFIREAGVGSSDGILLGCSAHTTNAINDSNNEMFSVTPIHTDKIFVLDIRAAQVAGVEKEALRSYYLREGKGKNCLYLPESLSDSIWHHYLEPSLGVVTSKKCKRVSLDLYFNVISLSELNSVVFLGDLKIKPFRVPCIPGNHSFGVYITNPGGSDIVFAHRALLVPDDLNALVTAFPGATLVVSGPLCNGLLGTSLDALKTVPRMSRERVWLTGIDANSADGAEQYQSAGYRVLCQGDKIYV